MEANCEQLPWQCWHSMDSGSQHSYVCLNNVLQRKLVSFSVPGLSGYFTTYADNRVITIGGNHLVTIRAIYVDEIECQPCYALISRM